MRKLKTGPMTKGAGYVFETDTLNLGEGRSPQWMLEISAAGTFHREDVEFIRDALTLWLEKHA